MPLVPSTASTPCVLCHSDDIEELSRRARDGRPLRTTICRRCGMVWANPPAVEHAVRTYYSEEYRQDYKGTPARTLPQIYHAGLGALARYRAIAHRLAAGDAILDVGCGGGELVYLLRRLGFDATGIEPNRALSEAARSVLGLPVRTGFVQDFDFPEGAFRAILMYHVLEHVDTPLAVLGRLRRWLRDDGRLIVEVPNIEARFEAPITRFHVAHLFYFSPATLEAIARRRDSGSRRCACHRTAARSSVFFGRMQGRLSRHSRRRPIAAPRACSRATPTSGTIVRARPTCAWHDAWPRPAENRWSPGAWPPARTSWTRCSRTSSRHWPLPRRESLRACGATIRPHPM